MFYDPGLSIIIKYYGHPKKEYIYNIGNINRVFVCRNVSACRCSFYCVVDKQGKAYLLDLSVVEERQPECIQIPGFLFMPEDPDEPERLQFLKDYELKDKDYRRQEIRLRGLNGTQTIYRPLFPFSDK